MRTYIYIYIYIYMCEHTHASKGNGYLHIATHSFTGAIEMEILFE